MKKLFVVATLLLALSISAFAASIEVTTSCGTRYNVSCDSCSTQTLVAVAIALDEQDC